MESELSIIGCKAGMWRPPKTEREFGPAVLKPRPTAQMCYEEDNTNLVLAFASAALDCHDQGMFQPSLLSNLLAFTTPQSSKFTELLKSNSKQP